MKHRGMMVTGALIIAFIVMVLGSSSLQTMAGSLFGPPPSPPPPPTGPLPPRAATFDVSQLKPPPPPPTIVFGDAPTLPRPNPVTPASDWLTYRDPNFGFSFQYPSNWHIDAPKEPRHPPLPEGTGISIQNYKDVMTKADLTADQLKIEIGLSSGFEQYAALDNWISQQKQMASSDPTISYSPIEHLVLTNISAARWTVKTPQGPQGIIQIAIGKGKWLYTINAYPATSKHIATFDRIVSTFQIP